MHRSLECSFFIATLVILLIVPSSAQSSESGVPVGMAGSGYGTLGEGPLAPGNGLSINVYPSGASMFLIVDQDVTAMDEIDITASGSWILMVEDMNTGNNKSKMRKYAEGGYVTPEASLTNKFKVLVDNIGNNGASGSIFNTLTDATDLSNPVNIVQHDGSFTNKIIDLMYSQKAHSDDVAGRYRISLQFTLSPSS